MRTEIYQKYEAFRDLIYSCDIYQVLKIDFVMHNHTARVCENLMAQL